MVKYELDSSNVDAEATATADVASQGTNSRKILRSRYLAMKNLINDERDDITRPHSDKFDLILGEVESLHQLVSKPREQVADAKTLLDITQTLVSSVKAHCSDELTPSDFVLCILNEFGEQRGSLSMAEEKSVSWKDIGLAVSCGFKGATGCCTMIGPMDTEIKQRKAVNQSKRMRVRCTEIARPEELEGCLRRKKTDTDENMSTMFNVLRKNGVVKLENLILNRNSFAQTVENLFALSFLVKDGRAEIKVNETGWQVSPRNAPAANEVLSAEVAFSHFVFRFDFKDWKVSEPLKERYICDGSLCWHW